MSQTSSNHNVEVAVRWFLSSQLSKESPRAVFPISRRCTIGRKSGLDFSVCSAFVSSKHAELSCLNGRLVLHDLGSRNGTYVNGERIRRPTYLAAGDLIRMGDIKFRVHAQTDTGSESPHPLAQLNENWIRSQMLHLLRERQFTAQLDPIFAADGETIAAHVAMMKSSVTGLETPEKMAAAAQWVGCEAELSREVRHAAIDSACSLTPESPLLVQVHGAENLTLEVIPQLHRTMVQSPTQPVVVILSDIGTRDSATLELFLKGLMALGMEWGLGCARTDQMQSLPTGILRPSYIQLHHSLTDSLLTTDIAAQRQMIDLIQPLQSRGTQVIATRIATAELANRCRELGIDLLHGSAFVASPANSTLSGTLDFRLGDDPPSDTGSKTATPASSESDILRKSLSVTSRNFSQAKTNPLSIPLIREATDWENF